MSVPFTQHHISPMIMRTLTLTPLSFHRLGLLSHMYLFLDPCVPSNSYWRGKAFHPDEKTWSLRLPVYPESPPFLVNHPCLNSNQPSLYFTIVQRIVSHAVSHSSSVVHSHSHSLLTLSEFWSPCHSFAMLAIANPMATPTYVNIPRSAYAQ